LAKTLTLTLEFWSLNVGVPAARSATALSCVQAIPEVGKLAISDAESHIPSVGATGVMVAPGGMGVFVGVTGVGVLVSVGLGVAVGVSVWVGVWV